MVAVCYSCHRTGTRYLPLCATHWLHSGCHSRCLLTKPGFPDCPQQHRHLMPGFLFTTGSTVPTSARLHLPACILWALGSSLGLSSSLRPSPQPQDPPLPRQEAAAQQGVCPILIGFSKSVHQHERGWGLCPLCPFLSSPPQRNSFLPPSLSPETSRAPLLPRAS